MKKILFVVMILAAAAYVVMGMVGGLIFPSGGHDVYAKTDDDPFRWCSYKCKDTYGKCITNAANDDRKKQLCSNRLAACASECTRMYGNPK
jgi:hypothetical protein